MVTCVSRRVRLIGTVNVATDSKVVCLIACIAQCNSHSARNDQKLYEIDPLSYVSLPWLKITENICVVRNNCISWKSGSIRVSTLFHPISAEGIWGGWNVSRRCISKVRKRWNYLYSSSDMKIACYTTGLLNGNLNCASDAKFPVAGGLNRLPLAGFGAKNWLFPLFVGQKSLKEFKR